jgi:hypothetical protein
MLVDKISFGTVLNYFSTVWVFTVDDLSMSTGFVIVSLLSDSLLVNFFSVSCCNLFLFLSFLICAIKFRL